MFFVGLKEGAVKRLFSLTAALISIVLASLAYGFVAGLLSFLPGENWENFLGFFITLGIIAAILHLLFWLPRKLIQKAWNQGLPYRILGVIASLFESSIGFVVFATVIFTYPIIDWLARWFSESGVMSFLLEVFSFVQDLLPSEFLQTPML
jgi:uncharacterized membrane protein required for colicin V production